MNKPEKTDDIKALGNAIGGGNFITPHIPENAPFNDAQKQWLNGLLTGLSVIAGAKKGTGSAQEIPLTPLTVLYGSQSGNCEALSKDLRKFGKTQGFEATISELDSFDRDALVDVKHLIILCSTFGEGDPPDNATEFYSWLMSDEAPALPDTVNYSVCGLGDSSYTHFNKAGQDIDERLAELGATRASDFISCDVAFEDDYAEWKTNVFGTEVFKSASAGVSGASDEPAEQGPKYDKNTPFIATVLETKLLNKEGSTKEVNHVEISLAGGGEDLDYQVGDALGVWPVNCADEVNDILGVTGFKGNEVIELKSGPAALKAALLAKLDLCTVTPKTLEAWGIEANQDTESEKQIFDILKDYKPQLSAQQLVDGLRPLQPRLYSISSSPNEHPGEVHLTVGAVRYELFEKVRKGVASTFFADRCSCGSTVGVYVQKSAHFHLPEDNEKPVIMVGPGTGIAPFRAFLEERKAREAKGNNWLFFGDQKQSCDYLYEEELCGYQSSGLLTKLSLAFSRDQEHKVYVQDRMRESGKELWDWLESGAHFYVCGDASRMAADVDKALHDVIMSEGNMNEDDAKNYVKDMTQAGRYQRDVY